MILDNSKGEVFIVSRSGIPSIRSNTGGFSLELSTFYFEEKY